LTGPDHLAATAPLAIESKKSSWLIGFRWGIGHTIGVLLVGFLALLLKNYINLDVISSYSESFVGLILIAIGGWGFYTSFKRKIHTHAHTHDGKDHLHIHFHGNDSKHDEPDAHVHTHAAFGVGIIHGLAGSSHLFGVLPALAFPTMSEAILYLLFFGLGTITAMILFSMIIGYVGKRFEQIGYKYYKWLIYGFNSIAITVGIYWIVIN